MHDPEPTLNILLVDDDPDDFYLMSNALKQISMPVSLAWTATGKELQQHFQAMPSDKFGGIPDIILLDLNMPVMDGKQVLQWIKGDERWRHIPVIIYTTSQSNHDIYDAYRLGANSYLLKQGNLDEIVLTMRCLCEYWLEVVRLPQ